jgi:integrase
MNRAWSKSKKEWIQPLDFLVVQGFDQYLDERYEILGAGGSDFLLVNLFREPLGAPMPPEAMGELFERLGQRAKLSRKVPPHMARRAFGSKCRGRGRVVGRGADAPGPVPSVIRRAVPDPEPRPAARSDPAGALTARYGRARGAVMGLALVAPVQVEDARLPG